MRIDILTVVPMESWTIHLRNDFDIMFKWNDEDSHYSVMFDDKLISDIEYYLNTNLPVTIYNVTVAEQERKYPASEVKVAREARLLH